MPDNMKHAGEEAPDQQNEACDTKEEEMVPQAEEPQPEEKVATEDEWRAALETAVKQRDEYLALAQRAQADFQNFKRRNAAVRADAYDDGVRETLTALLPVIDNLERAIASDAQDAAKLTEGVQMTLRQMLEIMGKMGLSEVPALGETFDPDLHNAVMRSEEGENGKILEVFQKGYRVKDKIVRYAMVKVSAK